MKLPLWPYLPLRNMQGTSTRLPGAGTMEEASSANSLCMDLVIYRSGSKRDYEATGNNVVEAKRASSRAKDDDENNVNNRKKLRLFKEQSAFLEESFKEHNTLNHDEVECDGGGLRVLEEVLRDADGWQTSLFVSFFIKMIIENTTSSASPSLPWDS